MTIIHIVESFAGGVFDFIADLTNGTANNENIIIYALREHTPRNFEKYFPKNTKFIAWKHATREISPKADILALFELIKILQNISNIDAIHLHSSKAGFLGRIAARRLNMQKRVLYTPHGVSFLRKDVSPLKHKIFVYLEKLGAYFGGRVVGCSHSEAEAFLSYNIKATYVNNGIACPSEIENITDNKRETITIGTVGRITHQKNPALFNAIAKSFTQNKQVEFLWIGGGELESQLTSGNIIKTGWLSRDAVDLELSKIDIYLSTSLWEGLPLSVLQAMCYEKPLLLSSCVGNRDLVKNNYNGMLFETLDEAKEHLNIMITDFKALRKYGENSKKLLLESFTLAQTIENYEKLYHEIER